MALSDVTGSSRHTALPEALARFSRATEPSERKSLRSLSLVALAVDVTMIAASLVVGYELRGFGGFPVPAAILIVSMWLVALAVRGGYVSRQIGVGSDEFKNVLTATLATFAIIASVAFAVEVTDGRKFLMGTFIAGFVLLPVGRRLMRFWLFGQRRGGHLMRRTLLVGSPPDVLELRARLDNDSRAGYSVVNTLGGPNAGTAGLDSWLDMLEAEIREESIDSVAVASSQGVTSEMIRRLSWRLEGPNVDLLVAPTLGDVSGPRINVRPAAGLPLLHLEEPRLTGPQALLKRGTDVFVSGVGLVVVFPLLLLIAVLVRITSPGPALFIQERVGKAGDTYLLAKFRTMHEGSEQVREDALGSLAGDPQAYRADPRITLFGRFLRRWSLDELPQLWNVLMGSMSLVGPRPMLVEELPLLGPTDHRRHLTKPGMTGLWQVAGRKEIAWNERMQMDLRYVENWSPALDLVIMVKTVKAVATGRGAH